MPLLSMLLLFTAFFSVHQETDWNKQNLKGRVHVIYETTEFAQDTIMLFSKGCRTSTFNEYGYSVSDTSFVANGNPQVFLACVSKYDGHNNVISSVNLWSDGSVLDSVITEYSYDSIGRLTRKKIVAASVIALHTEAYFYDLLGRHSETNTYNRQGELLMKSSYMYPKDIGRVKKDYDASGKLMYTTEYLDNTTEKTLRQYVVKEDGSSEKHYESAYDTAGNLVQFELYNLPNIEKWSMLYDSNHNVIRNEVTYSQHQSSLTEEFKYEYDEQGNWIRKQFFSNGVLTGILRRRIVYF